MFVFDCELIIGNFKLKTFNSVKITTSRKTLGDTAVIKIGDASRKQKLRNSIKVGDKVILKMGYKGYPIQTEFEGYVSEVSPNVPFEIHCLDEIFKMRRDVVKTPEGKLGMSWKKTTLLDVLKYILQGYETDLFNVPDVELAPFVIEAKVNRAQVLKKIKEEYGFDVYFRGNKLICALGYTEVIEEQPIFHLQKNVIKTDLIYRKKEDSKIKLKAVSILQDNTRVEVEVGDPDGEIRTWHTETPIKDKEKLKLLAEAQIESYKYEGYTGKIKTFGIPYATHSMSAKILDDTYPERAGIYFIEQVETSVSVTEGFKRDITFGKKAGR